MTRARHVLGPIAAIWLVVQAATLVLVPALLGASLAQCICTHGADATCPMHHKTPAGAKVCMMQSATTNVPATLNSLFSVAGLVPAPALDMVPVPTVSPVVLERAIPIHRPSPPDSPPPRV